MRGMGLGAGEGVLMQPFYRQNKYDDYAESLVKPAFVSSSYDDGKLMLYSHGGFDIWCVYEARPCDKSSALFNSPFVLKLFRLKRDQINGMSFKGSFLEDPDPDCVFDFESPKDVDYFGVLRELSRFYGPDEVWGTFTNLYESVPQVLGVGITKEMLELSKQLAEKYPDFSNLRETFDCLLLAMIAENNRDGDPSKGYYKSDRKKHYTARVGKLVKALGVYQTLYSPEMTLWEIAKYSTGKRASWIKEECEKVGIMTPYIPR